ncbi:MAG: chitobiase/beta-hexosaminidase C-terminal domain-containing protein, partial [Gammaproteobacteria bacterium]|nr:chitobiase/beta-hexosaminidase C-terminal domain-containing protein [Gammaproteobacteria bacterium]
MGHNLNNTHLTRIAAAVFLSASAFLTSCGGGSSPAPAVFSVQYTCAADEIPVTDGSVNSCRAMAQLDLDQDGVADGIDFNADGFAEILFKATSTAGVTGLDVNGDGISDYYMYTDGNGGYDLNTREDGKGSRVFLTTTIDGVLLGFDSNGDGVVDDDSLTSMANDVTAPTVVTDLTGGIFGGEQEITITCQDDVACHSIAYTLDGSAPDFAGNGTQILSGVGTVTIGPAEGAYTLRYIVRDANGLTSAIGQSEYFVSASSCPVVPSFDTVAYLEVNQSQNFNLTAENISYLYGTVSDISWTQSIVGSEDDLTSGAGSLSGATVNLTAPAQVTTYKFSVVARADNGCSSAPQTTFVYVMKNSNNAVFVDANTGFDTYAGSRAAPFATLS